MAAGWRLPATWAVILCLSVAARTYVGLADQAQLGHAPGLGRVLAIETSSHLVIAALLPLLYWMQRRWPLTESGRNLAIHVVALVPFSLAHTAGMAALRLLWFSATLGEAYSFPLTSGRLAYEFTKDLVAYVMLETGIVAMAYIFGRARPAPPAEGAPVASAPVASAPERFAVRKRGGSEVMVDVADIDWIEASGNYAILHVGGETYEIRSSLTRLEGELNPKRFVRVHKSHVVNITRVAEVTPWVSGDWRIRLRDGAEVNLSRRYRQRFEALAPVRT